MEGQVKGGMWRVEWEWLRRTKSDGYSLILIDGDKKALGQFPFKSSDSWQLRSCNSQNDSQSKVDWTRRWKINKASLPANQLLINLYLWHNQWLFSAQIKTYNLFICWTLSLRLRNSFSQINCGLKTNLSFDNLIILVLQ